MRYKVTTSNVCLKARTATIVGRSASLSEFTFDHCIVYISLLRVL